jgi:hypothetical protein
MKLATWARSPADVSSSGTSGSFPIVEHVAVILCTPKRGRPRTGIDQDGYSKVFGRQMIRIGAWLPVQVAQTVLSRVLTEQNIGVRNCAVGLSSAQDHVNYHNPGFREQLMKAARSVP